MVRRHTKSLPLELGELDVGWPQRNRPSSGAREEPIFVTRTCNGKSAWNNLGRYLQLGVVLAACLASLVSCHSPSTERRYGYLPLWTEAQQRCVAEYPSESLAQGHQGLAVAELEIGRDGTPLRVAVLQAPDDAIIRSVQLCAGNWRMKPVEAGGPDIRRGKLYFYFTVLSGKARVFLANDPADKKALIALRL